MLIEESDNVAVAVEPIQAGECTLVAGEEITANEYIKEGHKIARTDIEKEPRSSSMVYISAWPPSSSKGRLGT